MNSCQMDGPAHQTQLLDTEPRQNRSQTTALWVLYFVVLVDSCCVKSLDNVQYS